MGTDSLDLILRDDGYQSIDERDVVPGDVVVYGKRRGEAQHVAMVIAVEKKVDLLHPRWIIKVLSQWGADGEYIHELTDVPESYGGPIAFYSERSQLHE